MFALSALIALAAGAQMAGARVRPIRITADWVARQGAEAEDAERHERGRRAGAPRRDGGEPNRRGTQRTRGGTEDDEDRRDNRRGDGFVFRFDPEDFDDWFEDGGHRWHDDDNDSHEGSSPTVVPLPGGLVLLGTAIAMVGALGARRRFSRSTVPARG